MKVLSSQEQEKLFERIPSTMGVRNAMILRMFLLTGVRVSELCGLKKGYESDSKLKVR